VLAYRDKPVTPVQISQQLRATRVLTGSLRGPATGCASTPCSSTLREVLIGFTEPELHVVMTLRSGFTDRTRVGQSNRNARISRLTLVTITCWPP
jgi:hypothetical protein